MGPSERVLSRCRFAFQIDSLYNFCCRLWFIYESFIGDPKFRHMRIDSVRVMKRMIPDSLKQKTADWLRQGISPSRLALTLALGFAIGCIPVIGIPTLVCAGLALALRLNLPAIQAANYAVMPLQFLLIVPFVRLGGWFFAPGPRSVQTAGSLLHLSPAGFVTQMSGMAGQAMLGWLVTAAPAVVLITLTLTILFRRIPAFAANEVASEGRIAQ